MGPPFQQRLPAVPTSSVPGPPRSSGEEAGNKPQREEVPEPDSVLAHGPQC